MIRRYFHYEQLEEFHAGLWRIARNDEQCSANAATLLRDADALKVAMYRVVHEWPKSCLHNLTVRAANRIAWLGRAACCIGVASPDDATRLGWHALTASEQEAANAAAAEVLGYWEGVMHAQQVETLGC